MSYKLIIAGGGTGGHLFPGITLAQALAQNSEFRIQKSEVLFLCTDRPFDVLQLNRYGFPYQALPSPRFRPSPAFITKLISSVIKSYRLITKMRPDYIIGLGGYGSFPCLLAGKMLGIPIILLEQNLLPGKVTRWFSAWAKWVCCQWSGSKKYLSNPLRALVTGSPVRAEIKCISREQACRELGLNPNNKTLAILGGSQGAQAINHFITDNINLLLPYKEQLNIIHLTGERDYDMVKSVYEATAESRPKRDDTAGLTHYTRAFSEEMSDIYSAADLVIARAGGITIAELTALGIPAVLIPFPFAAENHQYLNAKAFARRGAGLMIEQKDLLSDKLKYIVEIIFNNSLLTKMAESSRRLGKPDAGQEIISLLIG